MNDNNLKNNLGIKTISPKVISASRATDIPAFHSDWFMDCLRNGSCQWQNPFNANQRQIVSFADTEAFVFWSKNPGPLEKHLEEMESTGKKFYFQFTLNDYEDENLEPGIPQLAERIATFARLSARYKVIWRYDPVILGDRLTVRSHMKKLAFLMKEIGVCTEKLVFSFVDLYGRGAVNPGRHNPGLRAPETGEMTQFCSELSELRGRMAPHLKLATCAEADMDFHNLDISKNSCIDPALINSLCGREIFRKKPGTRAKNQQSLFAQATGENPESPLYEKDKGQRKACQCAPSKDIGSYRYHPCKHRCIYCYAGHARKSY